ncbi:MAG: extracellular solute-binding protein, partial [Chloroflexia bacterium]|nr:extracellular solute-binding protein [Chloroflexia bacterium]
MPARQEEAMQPDRPTVEFLDEILHGKVSRRAALRRAAGLGIGASALATMLASRATSVAAKQSTPSPVASPSPSASPAASASYTPQGPGVERLVFWTRSSQDTSPNEWNGLVAVADAYQAAVGTTVELVTVPDADFRSRLSLAAPSGEGPDVLGPIAHDWIGELAIQQIAQPWTQDTIAGFADLSQSSVQGVTVNGQIYGVPLFSEALALVYNTDMVPEAPTTWDDLVARATELTSGDVYGFVFPILTQYYQGPFFYGFDSYVFAFENGAFDTADIGLNNAGGVETASFLRDMYHQQQPAMPEPVLDQANAGGFIDGLMEAQQLAMTIAGPWREPPLTDAGVNYAVAT